MFPLNNRSRIDASNSIPYPKWKRSCLFPCSFVLLQISYYLHTLYGIFLLFNPYLFIIDTPLQCFCMRFYKDVYFTFFYSSSGIFRYIFDAIYLYFRTVWNFVRICCYCSVYLCFRSCCGNAGAFPAALRTPAVIRYFKCT